MHIIMLRQAPVCGRLVAKGSILDLPETEAQPVLDAGDAASWPVPLEDPVVEEPEVELDANGVPIT